MTQVGPGPVTSAKDIKHPILFHPLVSPGVGAIIYSHFRDEELRLQQERIYARI